MEKEMLVSPKDESYSLDEVKALCALSGDESVKARLCRMEKALEGGERTKALFFMPEATFGLFAAFNGCSAICPFGIDDVRTMKEGLKAHEGEEGHKLILHLEKKLDVLERFILEGNAVVPVTIENDGFVAFNQ